MSQRCYKTVNFVKTPIKHKQPFRKIQNLCDLFKEQYSCLVSSHSGTKLGKFRSMDIKNNVEMQSNTNKLLLQLFIPRRESNPLPTREAHTMPISQTFRQFALRAHIKLRLDSISTLTMSFRQNVK